jgi:uncharacterized protein
MPEFIYLIHPFRQELAFHPTPEEEAILDEHLAYLQQAAEQGSLVLAGPSLDGIFGVAIFRAKDEQAAEQFMFNDPAVKDGLMVAELHPFRVSVAGKLADTGHPS